jgi:hypothetical protein
MKRQFRSKIKIKMAALIAFINLNLHRSALPGRPKTARHLETKVDAKVEQRSKRKSWFNSVLSKKSDESPPPKE